MRALSALFAAFPELRQSEVELEASAGGYYVVNSEGTEVRAPENVTFLRARATAQAPDGMTARDAVTFHSLDAMRMPGDAELTRGVQALAENVTALAHAPKGEDYSGPVLFEGMAGAQIFAEVLGQNLALARRPAMEPGAAARPRPSELEGRMGARVLPDSFDVVDDPYAEGMARPAAVRQLRRGPRRRAGQAAAPGGKGRAEGLPAHAPAGARLRRVQRPRAPAGRVRRRIRPAIGNLFVSSSETVAGRGAEEEAHRTLQARDKPYGILVRKMDFPSSATLDEVRRLLSGAQNGGRPVSLPILVYKVYPGRPRGAGARAAVPELQRTLAARHPGRGGRQQRVRVHG